MKYLLIAIVAAGCMSDAEVNEREVKNKPVVKYGSGFTVHEVDGCKYVLYLGVNVGDLAMVHAGSCTNPIHYKKP